MKISTYLTESGIRIPKDAKAAKIIYHQDLDGIFSAILTYRQLSKQGIPPNRIVVEPIQYGSAEAKQFARRKGQMIALVDFARLPEGSTRPDFWSDHHQQTDKVKNMAGGKIGATEYPSETEHLATIYASGLADASTIKAVSGIDSAKYSSLEDVINLPKDFKEAGRIERLAIIAEALLVSTKVLDNKEAVSHLIKTTNPSIVAFYNNLLKIIRLNDLQKEAVAELQAESPDWTKIEKIRQRMPTMGMKKQVVKEDIGLTLGPLTTSGSSPASGYYKDGPKVKGHKKGKADKHPEKLSHVKKNGPYPCRSETTPNRGDHIMGENSYKDDDMLDDLNKGKTKPKKIKGKNIIKSNKGILSKDAHTIDLDAPHVNEATLDTVEELEKLQDEWHKLAEQGKEMKVVAPEKWARLRELVNEHQTKISSGRQETIEKQTDPTKTKFSKVGKQGLIIKQNPTGGSQIQRYIGSLLSKPSGERYPFVMRRYPTFMQVAANPDLPEEMRKNVDFGKATIEVLEVIAKKFENKYNKWAFDIIRKESGGHASITNVSGLGTLGLVPQKLFLSAEMMKLVNDTTFEEKIKKDIQKSKREMSEEEVSQAITKAKQVLMTTSKARDTAKEIKALEDRLKKLKTMKTSLRDVMPTKWILAQYLAKYKEVFAAERTKIMDQIEDEFRRIIEEKYGQAKVTKPLKNPEVFKAKRPDTQKEIIQRLVK